MRTRKRKPHIAHILTVSLVWLILSAGGDVALSAWQPPIGIPYPEFGIDETYRIYDDDPGVRNGDLAYQASESGGYFTHYVDNDDGAATDTDNEFGSIAVPRLTIPYPVPAGSVVEVHGTTYTYDQGGATRIKGWTGTEEQPIFIRGTVDVNHPYFTYSFSIEGEYLIFENLAGVGASVRGEYAGDDRDTTYVCVRACDFYHTSEGGGGVSVTDTANEIYPVESNHIVIYNNKVHDFGHLDLDEDEDCGGLSATSRDVWIVDNEVYNTSGSGMQFAGPDSKRIYVGRNEIYDCRQAGMGYKRGANHVYSENVIHDIIHTRWSHSKGIGMQYGSGPVWVIYNTIYNCVVGINAGDTREDPNDSYFYIIGNLIYDTVSIAEAVEPLVYTQEQIDLWETYSYDGISFWIVGNCYMVNNIVDGYRKGIAFNGVVDDGLGAKIINNIISNMTVGQHLDMNLGGTGDTIVENNLLWQDEGNIAIGWGTPEYTTLASFQIASGTGDNCIVADPLFVNLGSDDFKLQSGSLAINAGKSDGIVATVFNLFQSTFSIDIRKDIEGTPRTAPWDIGAYESVLDPDNTTPVFQAIGNKSVNENSALTFDVNATDPEDDTITYSVLNLPSGATFTGQTFSWTPSYDQAGTYSVMFIAKDDNQAQDSETITITVNNVNRAPILGPIANQSVNETALLSFSVDATDPDGQALSYSVSGLPSGAVFASQTFTWTPSYDQAGTHSVTFTANDGQAQDSQTITITVINVNRVPVLTAIGNKSAYADVLLTFTIDAADPDGDAITYSAGTLPSGATFTDQDFNWTPSQNQGGSYAVTFIASDGQLQDSETVIITVDVDSLAPTVTNLSPAAESIQVPLNNLITLNVTDAGIGVEPKSVKIKVRINDNPNNTTVYLGDMDHDISLLGDCRRIGNNADYKFVFQPTQDLFYYDQTLTITVNATDLAGNVMNSYIYSFATEMHSFGQNKQVNSGLDNNDRPVTVCDSSGNIWSAWQAGPIDNRDIYISKLTAGEENFNSTIQLTNNANDQCNPAVALDSNDKLYVVWQDNRQGDWDIYISTSVDGISWSTETRVNDPNDGNQVNPAIVIDGQNYAHVVWQDDRAGNQDIFIATSSDGFATPTVSQQITSDSFDQVDPAVAADSDNTIYVVWTDGRNGSNDIYGAASNNPWTNVAIVSNTNNQSSPAIATESTGSVLHLLWVDDTSGDNDIYYALSNNGLPGSPVTGSSIIDDSSGADQLDPTIAVTGSTDNNLKVFACWQDWRNTDTDLYFAELSSGSGTNVFVDEGGSNAYQGEPAVGIGEYGHPYIMWADSRSTNTDIYYAGSTFIEPIALASELVTASASGSTTVGTDPQAITTVDDVSIVVPAGACSYDVAITVTKIANPLAFTAPCLGGYDFGPSGIQFSQPVTITIPYAFSSSDSSVTPYWFNSLTRALSQQGITDIQDIPISSSLHALSFKTTHFTAFFLFAGGGATATIVGGGGGGGCSVSASGEGNIVEYMLPYIVLAVVMTILKMRDARDRKARNMTAGKC